MIQIPRPDGASVEPITMWAARINAGLTLAEASEGDWRNGDSSP